VGRKSGMSSQNTVALYSTRGFVKLTFLSDEFHEFYVYFMFMVPCIADQYQ